MLMLSGLLSKGLFGQTYEVGYEMSTYEQPRYRVVRTYDLPSYQAQPEELFCLTCNHCRMPPFNPIFSFELLTFRAKRTRPTEVALNWEWIADDPPHQAKLHFWETADQAFETIQKWEGTIDDHYTHANTALHSTFYQLEIIDAAGETHRSEIQEVVGAETFVWMEVFPNPGRDQVYVGVNGGESHAWQLRIFDAQGRMVSQRNLSLMPGAPQVISGVQQLSPGLYVIELQQGGIFLQEWLLWEGN